MTRPIVYFLDLSPPCRAVALTAKYINLDLEIRVINLLTGDHLTPEFIKVLKYGNFIFKCILII